MWSYAVHNIRTGGQIAAVAPSGASWTHRMAGTGTGKFDFKLTGDTSVPEGMARSLFAPKDQVIVAKWNDEHVAYAGVITGSEYTRNTGTLSVNTEELRSVFRKRFTGSVDNYGPSWNMNVALGAHDAAHSIVGRSLGLGAGYGLPVVVADDMSPTPSIVPSWWEFGANASLIPSSVDPSGYAIGIKVTGGSTASRAAIGPRVPVSAGDSVRVRATAGPDAGTTDPAGLFIQWELASGEVKRERVVLFVASDGPRAADVTATAPSGTVAARFECYVDSGTSGGWYFRQFDVRPLRSVLPFTREIRYWETVSVDSLLQEIEDQGCVVEFTPELMPDGRLIWVLSVEVNPNRGLMSLSIDAPGSVVSGLTVTTDGAKQATGVLAVGKGSGKDMRTGADYSTSASSKRDVKVDAKDTDKPAELAVVAREALRDMADPVEQWSFKVRLSDDLSPADVRPGRRLDLSVFGDQWIPDGHVTKQVIALAGDMTMTVTPEVQ